MSGNGIGGNLTQFERNKYFYGKLMTVRDFETEQSYFNEKRHLLNWLIHGIGIVCGLEITEPRIDNGKLKIKLSPGVALDCCGHEIVVGEEFIWKELEVKGTVTDGSNYIYLKYAECEKESVPVLANVSTCEEVCCYNRMEEVFELELGDSPDKDKVKVSGKVTESDGATTSIKGALVEALQNGIVKGITITNNSGGYTFMLSHGEYDIRASASGYEPKVKSDIHVPSVENFVLDKETAPKDSKELWGGIPQEYYEEHMKLCPECDDAKVLLAVVDKSGEILKINEEETYKYRAIVYNNPMLYDLLISHLIDFNNPHKVTAEQTEALKSVENLSNPGGNIDLDRENAITIRTETPTNADPKIIIGENHSKEKNNPHEVTAKQIGALVSVNKVNGDSEGNLTLINGPNIDIKPNPVNNNEITISATAVGGGTTGVIKVGVTPNSAGVKEVSYGFTSEFPPMVSLGLVRDDDGVFMEDPILFMQKFDHLDISREERKEILKELDLTNLPSVFFKAYDINFDPEKRENNKFKILVVNLSGKGEFTIRWWAIPASKEILAGRDVVRIVDVIRDTHGEAIFERIVAERNVPKEKVRHIINSMMVAIESKPEGITVDNLSKDVKLNEETIKPILETLEANNILTSTGTGARKRFILRR